MDEYPKKKKGRVKVGDIDPALVYKLATVGSTLDEIGYITGVSPMTIKKHFGDIIEQGSAIGKRSLRKRQFERAMEGSDRMLIWLGKQQLGQKETPADTDDDLPLQWSDD